MMENISIPAPETVRVIEDTEKLIGNVHNGSETVDMNFSFFISWIRQCNALLRKNIKLVFLRSPMLPAIAVLAPVVCLGIIAFLPNAPKAADWFHVPNDELTKTNLTWPTSPEKCVIGSNGYMNGDTCSSPIFYAPMSPDNDAAVRRVAEAHGFKMGIDVVGFISIEAMTSRMLDLNDPIFIAGGFAIVNSFDGTSLNAVHNGSGVFAQYPESIVIPIYESLLAKGNSSISLSVSYGTIPDITKSNDISKSYIENSYLVQDFRSRQQILLPMFMFIGFYPLLIVATRMISGEKQDGLIAPLQRLGLYEGAYLTSNFISLIALALIAALTATAAAKMFGWRIVIFANTHGLILFLVFAAFAVAMIGLANLIASIPRHNLRNYWIGKVFLLGVGIMIILTVMNPENSSSANGSWNEVYAAGIKADLLSSMPWFLLGKCLDDMSIRTAVISSSRNGTVYGKFSLDMFDDRQPVMYSSQVTLLPDGSYGVTKFPYQSPSTANSVLRMLLITAVYYVIAWYLAHVWTTSHSISHGMLFFLSRSYWRGYEEPQDYLAKGDSVGVLQKESRDNGSVILRNLSKTYNRVTALKELSCTLSKDEITGLLGQNGSGKSSTIGMITGMVKPSAGHVFVLGHAVNDEREAVCKILGCCTQDDFLWNNLSAREHLELYLGFRSRPSSYPSDEEYVIELLEAVGLDTVQHRMVGGYSGGMKRRLSVILSLIGDPKLLILDEPTTVRQTYTFIRALTLRVFTQGMDPINRRRVWKLIEKSKRGRVVLLTTHSMEEADSLCDRVCILHNGQLKAHGSPASLKSTLGKPFELTLLSRGENESSLKEFVTNLLPGCEIVSCAAGRVQVAVAASQSHNLPQFFHDVKSTVNDKGATRECSIGQATMAQVFLKLCKMNQVVEDVVCESEQSDTNGFAVDVADGLLRCCLCGIRATETVSLYTKIGVEVRASDLVCGPCAKGEGLQESKDDELDNVSASEHLIEREDKKKNNGKPKPLIIDYEERVQILSGTRLYISQLIAMVQKYYRLLRRQRRGRILSLIMFFLLFFLQFAFPGAQKDKRDPSKYCTFGDSLYLVDNSADCDMSNVSTKFAALLQSSSLFHTFEAYPASNSYASTIDSRLKPKIWVQSSGISLFSQQEMESLWNVSVEYRPVTDHKSKQEQLRSKATPLPDASDQTCVSEYKFDFPVDNGFQTIVSYAKSQYQYENDQAINLAVGESYQQNYFPDYLLDINSASNSSLTFSLYSYQFVESEFHTLLQNVWSKVYFRAINGSLCNFVQFGPMDQGNSRQIMMGAVTKFARHVLNDNQKLFGLNHVDIPKIQWFPLKSPSRQSPLTIKYSSAMIIILSMFLLPFIANTIALERRDNLIFTLKLQGLHESVYWISTQLFAAITSFILSLIAIIGIAIVHNSLIFDAPHIILLFIGILAWSMISGSLPLLIITIVNNPSIAMLLQMLLSTFTIVPSIGLSLVNDTSAKWVLFFPSIMFGGRIVPACLDSQANVSTLQIVVDIFTMLSMGIVWIIVCISIMHSNDIFIWIWQHFKPIRLILKSQDHSLASTADEMSSEPDDVLAERLRVELYASSNSVEDDYGIVTVGLSKTYPGADRAALDNITLGVKFGETLALLGPNGSGKSTFAHILSGLVDSSSGIVSIDGKIVTKGSRIPVGVCPQFDRIWPDLTVRETLEMFARIRGCPSHDLTGWVQSAAEKVNLEGDSFLNLARQLSGGQRRRLSVAVSLMGDCPVVLLDEPSTGIDVVSRALIWKLLDNEKKRHRRAIVLTTHSMEEADALCTRIAVLAGGELRCIGSQPALKRRFGDGMTISMSVQVYAPGSHPNQAVEKESISAITDFIRSKVASSARRVDNFASTAHHKVQVAQNRVTGRIECMWKIPLKFIVHSSDVDLERTFATMQHDARRFGVYAWSIEEPTLDDVFVKVAGNFVDEE